MANIVRIPRLTAFARDKFLWNPRAVYAIFVVPGIIVQVITCLQDNPTVVQRWRIGINLPGIIGRTAFYGTLSHTYYYAAAIDKISTTLLRRCVQNY
ncbi:MAG: hypothetical protein PVH37_30250 [Desulfobacterales bacterium]